MSNQSTFISEFLDIELLSRLPDLELQAKFLVNGFFNGTHKSPFRGSNAEFKEHREYIYGDSLSMVDWKVYAKTERLVVRQFEEDKELSARLFLDVSRSMNYASKDSMMSKHRYSVALIAGCMLAMQKNKDLFSLNVVGDNASDLEKPASTLPHFRKMLELLRTPPEASNCDFGQMLEDSIESIKSGTIVILVSDFYADIERFKLIFDKLQERKCEVILFHILDHAEYNFDYQVTSLWEDCESGEKLTISPELARGEYLTALNEHIAKLNSLAKSHHGDYQLFTTDRVPLEALSSYFYIRNRRRGR